MSDVSVFQFEVFNFSRFSASCIWIISPLCRNVKWSFWCFVCFGHLNLSSFSQRWTKILWITIQFTLDLFVFPMGVESVIPEALIWEGSTPAGIEVPFSPAAPADTFGPLPEKPSQVRVVWRWLSPPPLAPNPPPSAWESLGLFQSSRSHPAENSRKQPPGLLSMSLKHRGSLRPGIMSESPFLKCACSSWEECHDPQGKKGFGGHLNQLSEPYWVDVVPFLDNSTLKFLWKKPRAGYLSPGAYIPLLHSSALWSPTLFGKKKRCLPWTFPCQETVCSDHPSLPLNPLLMVVSLESSLALSHRAFS